MQVRQHKVHLGPSLGAAARVDERLDVRDGPAGAGADVDDGNGRGWVCALEAGKQRGEDVGGVRGGAGALQQREAAGPLRSQHGLAGGAQEVREASEVAELEEPERLWCEQDVEAREVGEEAVQKNHDVGEHARPRTRAGWWHDCVMCRVLYFTVLSGLIRSVAGMRTYLGRGRLASRVVCAKKASDRCIVTCLSPPNVH